MQIFIARGEDSSGPFTLEQVQDYLEQGTLLPEDLAYHEGLEGWIPLSELMNSITSPESTVSEPLTKKAVLMGIAQRVFACLIIVGFFLPWCNVDSSWVADVEHRTKTERLSDKRVSLRQHLTSLKAVSGASGLDLATKQYLDIEGQELMANPALFFIPFLALVGAAVHKRKVYIGYPPLALISLLVMEHIFGHIAFRHPNSVLWGIYLILVIVFITGIVMPKEGRGNGAIKAKPEPKPNEASDSHTDSNEGRAPTIKRKVLIGIGAILGVAVALVIAAFVSDMLREAKRNERVLWELEIGGDGSTAAPPTIGADGIVYVGGDKLFALDENTGDILWQFDHGSQGTAPAIGLDGTLFIGARGDRFFALDGKTGETKWEIKLKGAATSPVIGADGTVFIGLGGNRVVALGGLNGVIKWEFRMGQINPNKLSYDQRISSPALGEDGTVFIGSADKKIYALDGKSGAKKWEFATKNMVVSTPAIGKDGTVVVGSRDNNIYALNGKTGEKKWVFDTGDDVYWAAAIGNDGTVYVGSQNNIFYALDGKTGAKKWEYNKEDHWSHDRLSPRWTSPVIGTDGTVYVGTGHRGYEVFALDCQTGAKKWEFRTRGWRTSFPAIGENGTLFVGTGTKIYALKTDDQNPGPSPWPMAGRTPQHTGRAGGSEQGRVGLESNELAQDPGTVLWEFQTRGNIESSPAIGVDGTVYFGTVDAHVYAVDSKRGIEKWKYKTGGFVTANPAIGIDGTIYVGSHDKNMYALDGKTGTKKWAFATGNRFGSSPSIGPDGTVYFGSSDKKVYAVNGTTGVKKWEFTTGAPVQSTPSIGADGTVYFGSGDKKVYAVDGASGNKKWEFQTRGPIILSSPAIGSDGTIYIGSMDRRVYALDGQSGAEIWSFKTDVKVGDLGFKSAGVHCSPTIGSDGTVFVGTEAGKLYALNGKTGAKKWEFEASADITASPAIGDDGTIYVGSQDSNIYALDGETGTLEWKYDAGHNVNTSPAIGPGGIIYVGSRTCKLYAIKTSSQGLADSPWPMFGQNPQHTSRGVPIVGPVVVRPRPVEKVVPAIGQMMDLVGQPVSKDEETFVGRRKGIYHLDPDEPPTSVEAIYRSDHTCTILYLNPVLDKQGKVIKGKIDKDLSHGIWKIKGDDLYFLDLISNANERIPKKDQVVFDASIVERGMGKFVYSKPETEDENFDVIPEMKFSEEPVEQFTQPEMQSFNETTALKGFDILAAYAKAKIVLEFESMPEIDLSQFTAEQKQAILERAHKDRCDCGCGFNVAGCRNKDTACRTSVGLAKKIVEEITGVKRGSPKDVEKPEPTAPDSNKP